MFFWVCQFLALNPRLDASLQTFSKSMRSIMAELPLTLLRTEHQQCGYFCLAVVVAVYKCRFETQHFFPKEYDNRLGEPGHQCSGHLLLLENVLSFVHFLVQCSKFLFVALLQFFGTFLRRDYIWCSMGLQQIVQSRVADSVAISAVSLGAVLQVM